jgi:hypothetical protein
MLLVRSLHLPTLLFLSVLGACRAPHVPATAGSGCHPACAGATTPRVDDAGAELRGAAARPLPALDSAEKAPSPLAYLCPMHLHVGADEPGRCPECNMKLVSRDQVLEHDHDR